MSNAQYWNSITFSSKEFKDKYYKDAVFWVEYGEDVYNAILQRESKVKTIDAPFKKGKRKVVESEYAHLNMSELNSLATKISIQVMTEFPNTWKDKLKSHKQHKAIIKQSNKLKSEKNGH